MSQVIEPQIGPLGASPVATASARATPSSSRSVLTWAVGASLLLVGSGVVRAVQAGRYEQDKSYRVECPFPLNTIPRTVGDWQVLQGSETVLDPMTTRITGSTDHVIRTYVDEMTGVMLSVLILFGPAEPVLPHTPQICYPSSGFQAVGNPVDRDIKIDDTQSARFRSSVFVKSGGRSVIRNTVYHSFLLRGPWTPAIGNEKFPRKNPGIFKVQIQRRVVDGESLEGNEPIEDFLKKLIPMLDKMIANAPPAVGATVATNAAH